MRFKRYRKKRGYRSRVVKMKFQSFFDISTQDGTMQIITVNAGGNDVFNRLAPFFSAYKHFRLGAVSLKMIPASTLPVDPTGLSYEEGDNLVDPRDQLTPGMCRITNGEDILEDITGMTSDDQHSLYNNMLLDPRWYKWMLQTGVKRSATPRYWQIGQLHQDKWPGSVVNIPDIYSSGGVVKPKGTEQLHYFALNSGSEGFTAVSGSSHYGIFQTGHKGKLGWLPTDSLQHIRYKEGGTGKDVQSPMMANIPEIEVFKILMPPAYKTKYYYRAFLTETVYFKDPIVMNVNGFRPVDVFHWTQMPGPALPSEEHSPSTDAALDIINGGNDGSD